MRSFLMKMAPVAGKVVAHVAGSVPTVLNEGIGLAKIATTVIVAESKKLKEQRTAIVEMYKAEQGSVQAQIDRQTTALKEKRLNTPIEKREVTMELPAHTHTPNGVHPVNVHPDLSPV